MLKRIAAVLITFSAIHVQSATHTVAKDGSAEFTSVQAAINAAKAGDIVEIVDLSTYNEQVTIDSTKNGLTLRSSNPTSPRKPVIMWQDKVNVGPKNYEESKDPTKITYDQNGTVRIIKARGVIIDGIICDGGGAYTFGYPAVWCSGSNCPLFHGNAALDFFKAGDAVIRNCEFQNAFYGIYISDPNEEGITAKPNPDDTLPWNVTLVSGFSRTGNHLIEYNRIHNNSYGISFESTWNLFTTIRYNLIYENHHPSSTFALQVKALPDGMNQPGGAIILIDTPLSPVAVYNNTFWHNFTNICGHFQPGSQHLVFNNIFGKPNNYWAKDLTFAGAWQDIDLVFPYRMHNCVYACQYDKPLTRSQNYTAELNDPVTNKYIQVDTIVTGVDNVRIMNGMDLVEIAGQNVVITIHLSTRDTAFTQRADWIIQPGALITKPFLKDANIRWLETDSLFKSLDPSNPDFLVPNWNDTLVKQFIIDKGWQEAGIRDSDGSVADLGAISKVGVPNSEIMIKPTSPVTITGTSATATFNLYSLNGTITNPKIKYLTWINNLPFQSNSFATTVKPIPAASLIKIPLPITPIASGNNSITFTVPVPVPDTSLHFAILEMTIEGEVNGKTVTSDVGFLPYREWSIPFKVEIWDDSLKNKITEVKAGDTVQVKIILDSNSVLIHPDISLGSGYELLSAVTNKKLTTDSIKSTVSFPVIFTRVPQGGNDQLKVMVIINNISVVNFISITVMPGKPEKILFQDPPTHGIGKISIGETYNIRADIFDKYYNLATSSPDTVAFSSLRPLLIDIKGNKQVLSSNGSAKAIVMVTGGNLNDTIILTASLPNGASDLAFLVVDGPLASVVGIKSQKNQMVEYLIFDLRGRLIETVKSHSSLNVLLQRSFNIPKGVYIVREISVDGKRMSAGRRLIVKR